MNDDVDVRLRDGLRGAPLPAAPEALHDYLAELGRQPAPARQRRRGVLLVALVPIAAVLVGIIALMGGSSPNPSPISSPHPSPASSPSPSAPPQADATIPATVDGLTVQTVSDLLAARAAGDAHGGPYALRGYWTERSFGHSCVPSPDQPGVLELYCDDGEWGITELDEPILDVNFQTGQETRATGPHLTPYIDGTSGTSSPPPDVTALFGLPAANGQPWPPVPIVVVGHFDDPRAADCRMEADSPASTASSSIEWRCSIRARCRRHRVRPPSPWRFAARVVHGRQLLSG